MPLSPYAKYLDGRDALAAAAETPARLAILVNALPGDEIERPRAPGQWSARHILCHLADCEIAFALRFRQALAEPDHVLQPFFDQDLWARSYAGYAAGQALDVFRTLRSWNLVLLKSLPADAFTKPVTHPEWGSMSFQALVETMAGHDLNHLKQLEELAKA